MLKPDTWSPDVNYPENKSCVKSLGDAKKKMTSSGKQIDSLKKK
jgi:hypothetical protein